MNLAEEAREEVYANVFVYTLSSRSLRSSPPTSFDYSSPLIKSLVTFGLKKSFLVPKIYWFNTGISWYESKVSIVREAVRAYLGAPWLTLPPTA